jgi:hypothetical protein
LDEIKELFVSQRGFRNFEAVREGMYAPFLISTKLRAFRRFGQSSLEDVVFLEEKIILWKELLETVYLLSEFISISS